MPRNARVFSHSGIYHIMLRGINHQQIFYDEEDFHYFVHLLERFKKVCGYELYAYCLMGNHIHLLLRVKDEPLEIIFRRIGSAFVYWYNLKYERAGHLFQDRFKSEVVDSEVYFLTVLRYILRNPVAAGLCGSVDLYAYSSGKEYLLMKDGITDKDFALSLMPADELRNYIILENDDHCLEAKDDVKKRCSDSRAKELILKELGTFSPAADMAKDREALNRSIISLTRAGISIRQLSRLTGLSKKIIENARRTMKKSQEKGDREPSPVSSSHTEFGI